MAYIIAQDLAGELPLDGQGLSTEQIQLRIDAAIEEIVGRTGDTEGESALLRQAVINLATAELFDTIIYPQDARRPGTESSSLRASAQRDIATYLSLNPTDGTPSRAPSVLNNLSSEPLWRADCVN